MAGLEPTDLERVCGPTLTIAGRIAKDAYERMTNRLLPGRLKPGPFRVSTIHNDLTRVWTYSEYDPIDLPSELLASLAVFDGRSPREALKMLEQRDLIVTSETLRTLIDHEVLVPA